MLEAVVSDGQTVLLNMKVLESAPFHVNEAWPLGPSELAMGLLVWALSLQ